MKSYSVRFGRSKRAVFNAFARRTASLAILGVAAGTSQAQEQSAVVTDGESAPATAASEESMWDRIWGYSELYKNPDNKVIQSLNFTGRYQADYAWIDDPHYSDLSTRRFRLGAKAKMFQDFTVHAEVDIAPEDDPLYNRLTDAYIAWSGLEDIEITLGKQSAPFTLDGSTSSKRLLTIDRSNVANNLWFTQEYFPGLTIYGEPSKWSYHAGVYATGNDQDEFGHFDGSAFGLASLGYDFSEDIGADDATLAVNYVYNGEDAGNRSTRQLEQVASINFTYARDKWGVRMDLSGGQGFLGQSDLWGAMVLPHYDVTDNFQVVARYTYVTSSDPNGVRLARYENQVSGRGDEYNEGYIGLNYYFYGHKLKVQTGVQYADMRDSGDGADAYSGWAWTTGVRLSW